MKYTNLLLLPITGAIRYFATYFLLFGVLVLMPVIFSLSWIWFIVAMVFILPLFFGLIHTGIAFVMVGIQSVHKNNLVAATVHAVMGLLASVSFILFYIYNQPTIGESDTNIFYFMWNESKLKSIVLGIESISIIIGILYSSIINPFMFCATYEE